MRHSEETTMPAMRGLSIPEFSQTAQLETQCFSAFHAHASVVRRLNSDQLPLPLFRAEPTRLRFCLDRSTPPGHASRLSLLAAARFVVRYDTVRHTDSSPAALLLRSLTVLVDFGRDVDSTYASKCDCAVFSPEIRSKNMGGQ